MTQYQPLNPQRHGRARILPGIDTTHLAKQQMLPLVAHEFVHACGAFPVVFVKNSETGQFQPIALLGFEQGENVFVRNGEWIADYVPGIVQVEPFRLVAIDGQAGQMSVAMDASSALVNESAGEVLFDEAGNPSAFLTRRRDALGRYFEHARMTREFVARLAELQLLVRKELSVEVAGSRQTIGGLYLVDEAKLRALDDAAVLDFHRSGLLLAIHSHQASLNQLHRLARLRLELARGA